MVGNSPRVGGAQHGSSLLADGFVARGAQPTQVHTLRLLMGDPEADMPAQTHCRDVRSVCFTSKGSILRGFFKAS